MLWTPGRTLAPSNRAAMDQFLTSARRLDLDVTIVGEADLDRLAEFDGLFIRDHTRLDDYTHQFALRAAELGLASIDDPLSMRICADKVEQVRLFERHRVPTPKTLLLHRENIGQAIPLLGLPCVVKLPDSSFSRGVCKVECEAEFHARCLQWFDRAPILVAQEYIRTRFDWRIGVLDRRPLFACRYHMVPGHWQVVQNAGSPDYREGLTQAVALSDTPQTVLAAALAAADTVGDGFYGVDVKECGDRPLVLEVNDNPNVDAGHEDALVGSALYDAVMASLARRIRAVCR